MSKAAQVQPQGAEQNRISSDDRLNPENQAPAQQPAPPERAPVRYGIQRETDREPVNYENQREPEREPAEFENQREPVREPVNDDNQRELEREPVKSHSELDQVQDKAMDETFAQEGLAPDRSPHHGLEQVAPGHDRFEAAPVGDQDTMVREEPRGYNENPRGYNEEPRGYNEAPRGYNEVARGYIEQPAALDHPENTDLQPNESELNKPLNKAEDQNDLYPDRYRPVGQMEEPVGRFQPVNVNDPDVPVEHVYQAVGQSPQGVQGAGMGMKMA